MAVIINSPRFINEGTIYGGLTMGDGRNYLDTRKGYISGRISMLGDNDTVLGETEPNTSMAVMETILFRVGWATIQSSVVAASIL
jgi:hypothetical protein